MTSPNVQIQNLLRKYVREKDSTISMNMVIDKLMNLHLHQSESISDIGKFNLTIPYILQTAYLTNFKPTFEYILRETPSNSDDIFEIDDIASIPNRVPHQYNEEVEQYMGTTGILSNIYGAELVDAKWILYGFIISKIHRTFKKNILTEYIQLKSLHLGEDSGSVQCVLNHLFTASEAFISMPVKWNWVSTDYKNVLYDMYKTNFIPILRGKSIWEQTVLIINKIAEMSERYNLIIYQINERDNLRNQYLFAIIMALRFTDQNSVFLLEFAKESDWTTLEINILGLCGMIFDMVYLTKYEIDKEYNVLVCSEKKKNIGTNILLKKLIKILMESNSSCILAKNIFPEEWLKKVVELTTLQIDAIPFMHMTSSISSILKENYDRVNKYLA